MTGNRSISIICLTLCCALIVCAAEMNPGRLLMLRGALALEERQAARAVVDLNHAAQMAPEDWRIQMLYGEALQQSGQIAMARGQLRRATLLAPTRPESWRTLATFAYGRGDVAFEIAALAGAQRVLPEDPVLQRRLAELYRRSGQKASADKLDTAWQASLPPLTVTEAYLIDGKQATLAQLRALAANGDRDPALQTALGVQEWRAGNAKGARAALQTAWQARADDHDLAGSYIHLCLQSERVGEALGALRALAAQGDNAFDRPLALWSLAGGNAADAVAPLRRLLAADPKNFTLRRQLGVAAYLAGDSDTAVAELAQVWGAAPDHLVAQQYAAALMAAGRSVEASFLLREACERYPAESMLGVVLTQAYAQANEPMKGAKLTEKLADRRPERVELLILAGERYFRAGHPGQTLYVANSLSDEFSTDLRAIDGAVRLYRAAGASSASRLVLTRYLGPRFTSPISSSEVLLLIARYAIEYQELVEADTALDAALLHDPGCRDAYILYGRVLQQQGRWKEAIDLSTTALARWRLDPDFSLALARAARESGNYPLAIRMYSQAARLTLSADPCLEVATLYQAQGDDLSARLNWQAAADRTDGAARGWYGLAIFFDAAQDRDRAAVAQAMLGKVLDARMKTRPAQMRAALARRGITASDDEVADLMRLDPDYVPAP